MAYLLINFEYVAPVSPEKICAKSIRSIFLLIDQSIKNILIENA